MPKLGICLWPTIFCPESPSRRSASEGGWVRQSLFVGLRCHLLSISRSSFYCTPKGETALNLALTRQVVEQSLETPFYGVRPLKPAERSFSEREAEPPPVAVDRSYADLSEAQYPQSSETPSSFNWLRKYKIQTSQQEQSVIIYEENRPIIGKSLSSGTVTLFGPTMQSSPSPLLGAAPAKDIGYQLRNPVPRFQWCVASLNWSPFWISFAASVWLEDRR